jgi:hypothetical protein
MKLYTEEDLKRAIKKAYLGGTTPFSLGQVRNQILEKLTPIELPSDEEIQSAGQEQILYNTSVRDWWILGATWLKDKIQGGNK